jgi:DNA-binding response OmpR family regulator
MNGPPSDGNESIVDIFVLSTRITESPVDTAPLEEAGYRVTVFTDSNDLIESLRNGKPNLLICDTVTAGDEAYDLCRDLKADYDCGVIPVLVVTSASDLSDLFNVLDCNADNFIASPYDNAYLLSLIEGMVSTPVERPNPDQIKTQFKIQHNDHEFVITADRRKLLEFLLSTFEITVTRTQDLNRSTEEYATLAASLKKTESYCETQAGTIERLNGTLRQKEQALAAQAADARDKERQLADRTGETERLGQELRSVKSLLASSEEQLREKSAETEESARTYAAETDALRAQVASLESSLASAKTDLAAASEALARETAIRADHEKNLSDTTLLHEQAEKTARALSLDCEQLRVSLTTEKNRAQSAEYEVKSVLQAKAESEQDLTRIISDLKDTAKQQAAELARRNEELDAGKTRIASMEIECATLTKDKEALGKERDGLEDRIKEQEAELDRRNGEIGKGNERIAGLETRLSALAAEKDAADATLLEKTGACQQELGRLEDRIKEQEAELDRRNGEIEKGNERIAGLETRLSALAAAKDAADATLLERTNAYQQELAEETTRVANLETYLSALAADKEAADATLRDRTDACQQELGELQATCDRLSATNDENQREAEARLDAVQQALAAEQEQHRADEENKNAIIRDRDAALELLRGEHQTVRANLDEHKNVLTVAKSELESALSTQRELEHRLDTATARLREREAELEDASVAGAASAQQARLLAGELETVKGELLESRTQSRNSDESLTAVQRALEQEQQARKAVESEREQVIRTTASLETEGRSRQEILSTMVRNLNAELDSLRLERRNLASRVETLMHEKGLVEEKASALSSEIDQARTALADEWEDHMNAQERLDAAVQKQLEQSLHRMGDMDPDRTKKRSVVVRKPDLPMEIARAPLPVPRAAAGPADPLVPRISSVEDLFEEAGSEEETVSAPTVSIVQEPATEGNATAIVGLPKEAAALFEDEPETDEGDEEEDGDESIDWDDTPPKESPGDEPSRSESGQSPDIAFNRAQWYDLLKWAHHSGTLSAEQRMQIVRMGRLIQKGRKLTHKQEDQVREMIVLVQAQGYRFI